MTENITDSGFNPVKSLADTMRTTAAKLATQYGDKTAAEVLNVALDRWLEENRDED